jgi:hypothetical protein
MYAHDAISLARVNLSDTSEAAGQRFSDSTMLTWLTQASNRLMRDVLFPSGRLQLSTVANQQEYQCGTVLRTDSVYLNGQLLVPYDSIATMEGHQLQLFDQGLGPTNPAPAPPSRPGSAGSGLPASTLGPNAPSWGTLSPQGYPSAFRGGWPAPSAGPVTPSGRQRPIYYYRSGSIGVVPAPNSGPPLDGNGNSIPNLVIDGVFLPPAVSSLNDPLIFPDHFCEALAWKICEFAKFSDDTAKSAEARTYAQASYRAAMMDCRFWARTYNGDSAGGPKVETSRAYYERGGYRTPARGSGYPN